MKKVVLVVSAVLFMLNVTAQTETNKFKFGFSLGANYSHFISKSSTVSSNDISNGIGGRLGLLMDYEVSDKFFISPKAELSFNQATYRLAAIDQSSSSYNIMPVSLDFMTHFAHRIKNTYLYFGPHVKIPVTTNSEEAKTIEAKTNMGIDLGVGYEKLTEHFTFAPELRYSFGLTEVSSSLPDVYFHNVSILFNFK